MYWYQNESNTTEESTLTNFFFFKSTQVLSCDHLIFLQIWSKLLLSNNKEIMEKVNA